MRNLARIGLVAAFAACAFVGGCNKGTRVEESAFASKTCATTCSDKSAACADKAASCSTAKTCSGTVAQDKAGCSAEKAAQCPATKAQN